MFLLYCIALTALFLIFSAVLRMSGLLCLS